MTRVALVGVGLMGTERWRALDALAASGRDVRVVGFLDSDPSAEPVEGAEAKRCDSLEDVVELEPDWVVVATPHDVAVEHTRALLDHGLRVLMEKPLGRTLAEAEQLAAARVDPNQLWVGHNYRFFHGIERCLHDAAHGVFGELVSAELILGHGGAPGMERAWKLDPERAGGGALIDPGIHLLDLARLLGGPGLTVLAGTAWSGFWETGVEEECHLLLRSRTVPVLLIQSSLVRWRSTFRLEVNGTDGYGVVEGRDRSYGPQAYRRGRRWGWQSASSQAESEVVVVEADGSDVLERELAALLWPGVDGGGPAPCSADEALATMQLLEECRRVALAPGSWTRAR